ncbi:hypothetical protein DYB26_003259 [Aphanomyces astaci]|uniref:Major facilitator superfamily (MFS) profile domain-containing protein n=1 Tax=Aphanomyces astaci TaxID=112090 RepID=A0A3R7ERX9_APHAT|nr:hypothetical protein DYB26_003259 [Aphanomyces astaci]
MAFRRRMWHKLMRMTFLAWRGWAKKASKAKRILRTALASRQATSFGRWVEFIRVARAEKERKVRGALTQLLHNRTETVLRRWRGHTYRMKNVHRMSARAVTTNRGYYFHAWRTGVQAAIFGRLQMLSAIQLQATWRRVLATRQTQHRRTAYAKAAVQIQAVVRGSQRRRQPLPSKSLDERRRSAFLVYAQSLNHDVAVACETRRQQAEDNVVKVAELAAVAALKVVQSSKEGTLELTKLAAAERALHVIGTHAVFLRTYGMTKAEAFAVVAQRQMDEALANAQVLARHTFRLLRPPPFACMHPDHRGAASFASLENYLGHATCSLTTTQIQLHVQLCDKGISGTSDSLKVALRLWNVGQRVLDMTNSTESVAEVAMDVITMPQLPLPLPASSAHEWKLVGQALTALKKWFHLATLPSSTLLSTDYTPTLERIRLATDLRWQVFRWLVSVVPPPSTTSQSDDPDKLVMRHLHHYDEANKAFYTRWAELEQKKLLGHFQRDASGMLQAVGTLARQSSTAADVTMTPKSAHPSSLPSTTWIFGLFCLINLLNFVDRGIIPGAPTQFQYFIKETLHIAVGDESKYLGLLASSFIASYAGFILLFGYLSIFIKPFHLVAVGLFVWCVAVVVCGASKPANSFYLLLFGRIVSGVGESSFQCIAPPFIDDHAPPAQRTLWLGIFFSCISVGTALGYGYGAVMANSAWGWGWAFHWEAIMMAPLVVACAFFIPDAYNRASQDHHHHHVPLPTDDSDDDPNDPSSSEEAVPVAHTRQPFVTEVWAVVNNAVFMLTVLGTAAFTFSLAGLSVFGPMFLIGLGLFDKETEASMVFGSVVGRWGLYRASIHRSWCCYSSIFRVVVISGVIGTPLGGLVLDWSCRARPHLRQYIALRQVFLAMTIGTVLSLLAWCLLPNKIGFLLCFGLALCFLFATTSSNAIVILLCVDPSRRSLAVGVNTLILHLLGDVPSPIILGALKDAWAPDCGSIEKDGAVVLNPDCANDFHGLLLSLLFPLLWMIWSVLSYGAAAFIVQRRLRRQGHDVLEVDGRVLKKQKGVFRVNCMDILNRTNVGMSLVARRTMLLCLRLDSNDMSWLDSPFDAFESFFKNEWTGNADAVSVMYAATGALQGGVNSVTRYYLKNFTDGIRQDSLDLCVGKPPHRQSVHV